MARVPNPLIPTATDAYIGHVSAVLGASPVDGADLLAQLKTFDQADQQQDQRFVQVLNLYRQVRRTTAADSVLIDQAIAAI